MAEYTLSVEIDGDASDLQKAFKDVKDVLGGVKKEAKQSSMGIGSMAKAFGVAQLAVKGASMALGAVRDSISGAVSRVDTLNQFPKVLEQMGYSGDEARSSIEKLSNGIQGLPTTLDDIAGKTQRMTTILGDIPLATVSTLALNDAFLASGASSADASRGLEQYMQMLSAGKVDMQAWKTLQETMPYALQRTAEAFGFTGQSAQKDFYQALKDGDITMDQFNAKLVELNEGTEGWHNTALEATKGIGTSFQNIKTAIINGVAGIIGSFNEWSESRGFGSIYENMDKIKVKIKDVFGYISEKVPVVLDAIVGIGRAFQRVWEWIGPLQPVVVGVVASFLGFLTVVSIVGKVTKAIQGITLGLNALKGSVAVFGKIGPAIKALKGAFTGLWATLLANPVVLIVAGIVAVGVALVYAYNKFEGFRNVVDTGIEAIKGFFADLGDRIRNIPNRFQETVTETQSMFDSWGSMISGKIEEIKQLFFGMWDGVKSNITSVWEGIKGYFSGVWNSIKDTAMNMWGLFGEDIMTIWDGIVSYATGVWELLKSVILGPILVVIDLLTGNWSQAGTDLQLIWENIKSAGSMIWEGFGLILSGIWGTISTTAVSIWESIKTSIIQKATEVKDSVVLKFEELKTNATNTIENLKNGAIQKFENLKSGAVNKVENLKSSAIQKFEDLKNGAVQRANKLKDDFISAISKIPTKVSEFIEKAKSTFRSLSNINLADIGRAIMNSLWQGLQSAWRSVKSWLSGIGDQIRSVKGPMRKDKVLLVKEGFAIMEGFGKGLEDGYSRVHGKVKKIAGEIQNTVQQVNDKIKQREYNPFKIDNPDDFVPVGYGGVSFAPMNNPDVGQKTIQRQEVNYSNESKQGDIYITVKTELDSKEISKKTYKQSQELMDRDTKMKNRRRGDL